MAIPILLLGLNEKILESKKILFHKKNIKSKIITHNK